VSIYPAASCRLDLHLKEQTYTHAGLLVGSTMKVVKECLKGAENAIILNNPKTGTAVLKY